MTRFTLVRHGQTDWNFTRRIQGTSDIPLNETGRAQARAAGARLAEKGSGHGSDVRYDVVAASPLDRAHETARLMAEQLGLPDPVLVPGVAERCYGEAEGMTGDELRALYPNGIEGSPIPGLESRAEVVKRATDALLGLAREHGDATVLVATHGAVIGSLLRALTADELPPVGVTVGNGSAHDFVVTDGALALVAFDGTGDVPVAT